MTTKALQIHHSFEVNFSTNMAQNGHKNSMPKASQSEAKITA